jgi:hypothetical protein
MCRISFPRSVSVRFDVFSCVCEAYSRKQLSISAIDNVVLPSAFGEGNAKPVERRASGGSTPGTMVVLGVSICRSSCTVQDTLAAPDTGDGSVVRSDGLPT